MVVNHAYNQISIRFANRFAPVFKSDIPYGTRYICPQYVFHFHRVLIYLEK